MNLKQKNLFALKHIGLSLNSRQFFAFLWLATNGDGKDINEQIGMLQINKQQSLPLISQVVSNFLAIARIRNYFLGFKLNALINTLPRMSATLFSQLDESEA